MNNVDSVGTFKLFDKTELFVVQQKTNVKLFKEINLPTKTDLVILCVQNGQPELSEVETAQLNRILSYLKKSFDNTPVVICTTEQPVQYQQINNEIPFNNLIVFGGNRKMLGLNIDIASGYTPIEINNQKFFFSHSLEALERDETKKRQLKPALDALFNK